jgi:hypothetical protein
VLGLIGGEGLSLEEYIKGLSGFSSLVEKGFPGYFLCVHDVYYCDLGCCNILVYG